MIRIDDTLLEEIGLIALPKTDRDQLLRQIYETLEMRVGMRLAERMTDQQLDEFERFIDTNDEAGALKWLEANFPDYKQVVADELEKLKGEIKKDAPKIMETMQSGVAPQPQPLQSPSYGSPAPMAPSVAPPAPQQFQAPEPAQQHLPPLPTSQVSQSQSDNFGMPQPLTPGGQDSPGTPSPAPVRDDNSGQSPIQQPGGGIVPPPPGV